MAPPPGGEAKIVVADDTRRCSRPSTYILRGQGFEVVPVDGGEEALSILDRERPDLVMRDIMMPKVDGLQLLERIRSTPASEGLPVLMISSMPPEDATARSLGLGADDFVSKPFRVKELVARVTARLRLLKTTGGNVTQAARMAQRNRTEFYKLLQRHKLEPSMFKETKG